MKQAECYFYSVDFTYEPDQEITVGFPGLKCAAIGINDNDTLEHNINFLQVLQDALKSQLHLR